jgi:hypothetical protein
VSDPEPVDFTLKPEKFWDNPAECDHPGVKMPTSPNDAAFCGKCWSSFWIAPGPITRNIRPRGVLRGYELEDDAKGRKS